MIVEVDPDTMGVEILKYVVVHDCGEVINPLILDGQIHGGVAQGLGNAFFEQLVFDDEGQLQNASFMDYLLPTSLDVPRIESGHQVTPSPSTPWGSKGPGRPERSPWAPLRSSGGGRPGAGLLRDPGNPPFSQPAVGAEPRGRAPKRGLTASARGAPRNRQRTHETQA